MSGAGMAGRPSAGQVSLLALIGAYRRWISPLRPPSCRFLPTCSEYAAEAITLHGVGRGVVLAVRRLLRCHPWCPGGYDPVPRSGTGASREGGSALGLAGGDRPR